MTLDDAIKLVNLIGPVTITTRDITVYKWIQIAAEDPNNIVLSEWVINNQCNSDKPNIEVCLTADRFTSGRVDVALAVENGELCVRLDLWKYHTWVGTVADLRTIKWCCFTVRMPEWCSRLDNNVTQEFARYTEGVLKRDELIRQMYETAHRMKTLSMSLGLSEPVIIDAAEICKHL